MDKNDKIIIGLIIVALVMAFFYFNPVNFNDYNTDSFDNGKNEDIVYAEQKDGEQVIELSVKNGNYYPQVIGLKQNIPAKIIVDMDSVKGCLTSIRVPKFKVSENVNINDNVIEFIPSEKGSFPFMCSMGMGTGTIIVE